MLLVVAFLASWACVVRGDVHRWVGAPCDDIVAAGAWHSRTVPAAGDVAVLQSGGVACVGASGGLPGVTLVLHSGAEVVLRPGSRFTVGPLQLWGTVTLNGTAQMFVRGTLEIMPSGAVVGGAGSALVVAADAFVNAFNCFDAFAGQLNVTEGRTLFAGGTVLGRTSLSVVDSGLHSRNLTVTKAYVPICAAAAAACACAPRFGRVTRRRVACVCCVCALCAASCPTRG
jgi:hypothetical protein